MTRDFSSFLEPHDMLYAIEREIQIGSVDIETINSYIIWFGF